MKSIQINILIIVFLFSFFIVGCAEVPSSPSTNYGTLKQIIPEIEVTQGGGAYKRSEAIVINVRLFFAFENNNAFWLVELNEDLSYKSSVQEVFSGTDDKSPHDIRLATDGTDLWYAYERVLKNNVNSCDGHFLSAARYDISGNVPELKSNKEDIAVGCAVSKEFFSNPNNKASENSKFMDDPTPIFYNGKYVIMNRAWNSSIEDIRIFDSEFNLLEKITLDIGPATDNKLISQNAMVNINGQIYLIGGLFYFDSPLDSDIYAIPLSNNLKSVVGKVIPLVYDSNKKLTKVTAARYSDGKLYINYVADSYQHLGVFDVNNNFESITQIQFQDESFKLNHASIEVLKDKAYVFYNEGELKPPFNIFGQVFEWQ